MSRRFRSICTLVMSCLALVTLDPASADVLDPNFDSDGFRTLASVMNGLLPLGSCPHADGSVSVVSTRSTNASLVTVRLRADGTLDSGFSSDGVAYSLVGLALDGQRSAVSCSGVGNSDPADDRMIIAATTPGTYDTAVLAMINLQTGGFDANFYLGGPGNYDISGLLFPPSDNTRLYPRVGVRGIFPGANGEWLLVGQLDGNTSTGVPIGFVTRINPSGALDALQSPNLPGFASADLVGARVGGDGDIRVLGDFRMSGGASWGLMRIQGTTLNPLNMSANGTPGVFPSRVHKARQIGGGIMVAGGLTNDGSAFGASPQLYVVRNDSVNVLTLPEAPALNGTTAVGPGGQTAVATGASGNRAIFVMDLRSLTAASVGYYAAAIQLGNGAGVTDALDLRFGSNGVASFALHGGGECDPGETPSQQLNNIASWGHATTLVGSSSNACDTAMPQGLVARIDSDTGKLFASGFE